MDGQEALLILHFSIRVFRLDRSVWTFDCYTNSGGNKIDRVRRSLWISTSNLTLFCKSEPIIVSFFSASLDISWMQVRYCACTARIFGNITSFCASELKRITWYLLDVIEILYLHSLLLCGGQGTLGSKERLCAKGQNLCTDITYSNLTRGDTVRSIWWELSPSTNLLQTPPQSPASSNPSNSTFADPQRFDKGYPPLFGEGMAVDQKATLFSCDCVGFRFVL